MARWLMKSSVESHLALAPLAEEFRVDVPGADCEVILRDGEPEPDPTLEAFLIFTAASVDDAADKGEALLRGFLRRLCFATGSRLLIKRRIALFEWDQSLSEHHGRIYRTFPDPNYPVRVLGPDLTATLGTLADLTISDGVERALRWFTAAVSADRQDEQFQFFWFAIETLAQEARSREPVPDRCPRCRTELYCRECEEVSTHRPYPRQAIEQLFHRHVSDDPRRAYEATSAMRHALLHANEAAEVEADYETTLGELVDVVGKVAWVALFDQIRRVRSQDAEPARLSMLRPSTFLHFEVALEAHMSFQHPEGRELQIDDIPNLQVDMVPGDQAPEAGGND